MFCVFSTPIGGVLFAIEVTGAYFSIKNYWRSFFAAVIATITGRLIRVLLKLDVTVGALFPTFFPEENAFFPEEMVFFIILGVLCGFLSIGLIVLHRKIVLCRRNNPFVKKFFDLHWSLYPIFISLVVSVISYPEALGKYLGRERKFGSTIKDFFENCTFSANENATNFCSNSELRENWLDNGELNAFLVLSSFTVVYFFLSGLAATLPIPNGASGAAFTLGAGFGRLFGEVIHRSFPDGIRNDQMHFVYPGIYSLVGAAAFCGGFTHTISPAIMIFEMTNQLVPVLPVLTAVLISTAICSFFQPSFYESLIQLKNLPFLADIPPSTNCHGIIAQQFMIKNEAYLTPKSTYVDAKKILDEHTYLKVIPVIENLRTKLLLGTLNRHNLELIINQLISTDKRHAEAAKRMKILSKVFSFKSNRAVSSQPNIASSSVESIFKNVKSEANLENERKISRYLEAPSIGRFTVTKCRGWQLVRQAIDDKRVHQLSLFEDYLLQQQLQKEQQQANKKSAIKELAQKMKISQVPDLHGEERELWEAKQLIDILDLNLLKMDSAPFRLIAETSLLNCYSLFSLLCLNRAYVTNFGKLVGVITLSEIKQALDDIQKGNLFPLPKRPINNKDSNDGINFNHFRRSFRRLARQSIVQFMDSKENPFVNKRWSQDIAEGLENKID